MRPAEIVNIVFHKAKIHMATRSLRTIYQLKVTLKGTRPPKRLSYSDSEYGQFGGRAYFPSDCDELDTFTLACASGA